ncbi:hypothetical protein ACFX13_045029 [Malus domestica]
MEEKSADEIGLAELFQVTGNGRGEVTSPSPVDRGRVGDCAVGLGSEPGKLIAGVKVYDDLLRRRADRKGDSGGSGKGDVDEVLMVGLIAVGVEWVEWKRWMGMMVCTKKGER